MTDPAAVLELAPAATTPPPRPWLRPWLERIRNERGLTGRAVDADSGVRVRGGLPG